MQFGWNVGARVRCTLNAPCLSGTCTCGVTSPGGFGWSGSVAVRRAVLTRCERMSSRLCSAASPCRAPAWPCPWNRLMNPALALTAYRFQVASLSVLFAWSLLRSGFSSELPNSARCHIAARMYEVFPYGHSHVSSRWTFHGFDSGRRF